MAPGGKLPAAPRPSHTSAIGLAIAEATPLQFPWPTECFSEGSALSFHLQSSHNAKSAERKTTKAINGQLLSIRSRIATVKHAVATSVAHIEFAANQKRQEVTKLDEKEGDESIEIPLCTASGKKPLKYRLPLIVTLIVVLMLLNESASRSRQPRSQASSEIATHRAPGKRSVPLCPFQEANRGRFACRVARPASSSKDLTRKSASRVFFSF